MASFHSFEDIKSWQSARALTRAVYVVTNRAPFRRDPLLCKQLRTAAVSVMSAIANGFEQKSDPQFVRALRTAGGVTGKLRSHLHVALDQEYIDRETFRDLRNKSDDTVRLIRGLIRYLQQDAQVVRHDRSV